MADPKGLAAVLMAAKPAPEAEDDEDEGLAMAAEEMLSAIKSGDAKGLQAALRNAFALLESEPHEEGESSGEGADQVA
jgi:hypothetical protein